MKKILNSIKINRTLSVLLMSASLTSVQEMHGMESTEELLTQAGNHEGKIYPPARPKFVQEAVDKAYQAVIEWKPTRSVSEPWGWNGSTSYDPCHINEASFITQLIQSRPDQKDFWIMDIGAGDHSLADTLREKLANHDRDIEIRIVSLAGNSSTFEEKKDTQGKCTSFKANQVKIENLNEELDKNIKYDFIISRMTFRHLVDPVGTFIQAYKFLTPNGFFFIDKFFFMFEGQETSEYANSWTMSAENMCSLLKDMKVPFLFTEHDIKNSITPHWFVLQKPIDKTDPCVLPWSYTNKFENVFGQGVFNSAVNTLTVFDAPKREKFSLQYPGQEVSYEKDFLCGDKDLYEKLNSMNAWAQAKRYDRSQKPSKEYFVSLKPGFKT